MQTDKLSYIQEVTMDTSLPGNPQFIKYYEKHVKYLRLKGLRPKTIEAYARAIRRIGNYFDAKIDRLSSDQLLDYFNDLLQSHSWSAVKLDLYGLKFFYTNALKRTWEDIPLIKPPKGTRIPDILTIEQADQLFAATVTQTGLDEPKTGLCPDVPMYSGAFENVYP